MNEFDQIAIALAESLNNGKEMDIPFLIIKKNIYTKRDLVNEIMSRTPFGITLITDIHVLTLEMLKSGKLKNENIEPVERNE